MLWWQQVLLVATVALVYIFTCSFLGAKLLPPLIGWSKDGIPFLSEAPPDALQALFVRWDAGYYVHIAEDGYSSDGDERVFFPLYPLTVQLIHRILGLPILWSGLITSVLSFLGAGLLMYQWVRIDYAHTQALWATVSMYAFPMAFFFVAFYGEPLLLLGSIASLYFARRGQFVASGIAIAFAGAARPTAWLLAIPYVIEFWQQRTFSRTKWIQFALGAMIAPTGMLAFLLFLARQSDTPSLLGVYAGAGVEKWQTHHTWPWIVLFDGFKAALFGANITPDWFSRFLAWHDLSYALLGLGISIVALYRIRPSYALFLLIGMLYFWTMHGPYGYAFWSIARRISILLPVYPMIALGLNQLHKKVRLLATVPSIILLGILSAWFTTGRWIA
jgi:hypothetical protein